jgi:hypothetical protein
MSFNKHKHELAKCPEDNAMEPAGGAARRMLGNDSYVYIHIYIYIVVVNSIPRGRSLHAHCPRSDSPGCNAQNSAMRHVRV